MIASAELPLRRPSRRLPLGAAGALPALALLAACTPEQPAGENTFYVSIPPLRSIVEGIVGDDFKIEVLVPPVVEVVAGALVVVVLAAVVVVASSASLPPDFEHPPRTSRASVATTATARSGREVVVRSVVRMT